MTYIKSKKLNSTFFTLYLFESLSLSFFLSYFSISISIPTPMFCFHLLFLSFRHPNPSIPFMVFTNHDFLKKNNSKKTLKRYVSYTVGGPRGCRGYRCCMRRGWYLLWSGLLDSRLT